MVGAPCETNRLGWVIAVPALDLIEIGGITALASAAPQSRGTESPLVLLSPIGYKPM
jgi:hypothetical protein